MAPATLSLMAYPSNLVKKLPQTSPWISFWMTLSHPFGTGPLQAGNWRVIQGEFLGEEERRSWEVKQEAFKYGLINAESVLWYSRQAQGNTAARNGTLDLSFLVRHYTAPWWAFETMEIIEACICCFFLLYTSPWKFKNCKFINCAQ